MEIAKHEEVEEEYVISRGLEAKQVLKEGLVAEVFQALETYCIRIFTDEKDFQKILDAKRMYDSVMVIQNEIENFAVNGELTWKARSDRAEQERLDEEESATYG